MPIDASIYNLANQPAQFGPNLQQIITLQNLAQQMQARKLIMDQEQQGQNALRQVFSSPESINAQGLPTPNALAQIGRQSPSAYMELLPQVARAQQTQALDEARRGKLFEQFDAAGKDLSRGITAMWTKVATEQGPQAADKAAQQMWTDGVNREKSSGVFPPDWTNRLPLQMPPIEELRRAVVAADAAEARPLTTEQQIELPFKIAGEQRAQAKERREQYQFQRGSTEKPDDIEVTKPDGTKEITVGLFDKDRKQYVTADGTNTPIEGKVRKVTSSAASGAELSPEALRPMVEQYLAGDRTVLQNIGRGAQGAANVVRFREELAQAMAEKGITGTDAARKIAEFEGLKAGERTLGTRAANIEQATNEAAALIPLVRERSGAVDRTRFPALNAILLAGERETGDPAVVQFGLALNSLLYTYARALNPTGVPRVSDMDHARELLSKKWSDGQINAALDQMQKEIEAAGASVGKTRREFGTPGTPASGTELSGGASAPIAPAAGSTATPSGMTFQPH